jgi:hypothetical protein
LAKEEGLRRLGIFANADSIADDAVCPSPQIEASFIACASSANTLLSIPEP